MNNALARATLRIGGGLSLVLFPVMFMMVFALHVEDPAEIVEFKLRHEPYVAAEIMEELRDPVASQRYYVLPHLLGYLAMPVLVAAALSLGYVVFGTRPWLAIIGATMTCIGAVFMAGMLAMWLSFAAIGHVPDGQVAAATSALEALIEMQGPLLLSTILTGLSLLGLMVLAVGLFVGGAAPRWAAAMIFAGSLTMTLFVDVDNLMFVGAFMTFVGMVPIARRLLLGQG